MISLASHDQSVPDLSPELSPYLGQILWAPSNVPEDGKIDWSDVNMMMCILLELPDDEGEALVYFHADIEDYIQVRKADHLFYSPADKFVTTENIRGILNEIIKEEEAPDEPQTSYDRALAKQIAARQAKT